MTTITIYASRKTEVEKLLKRLFKKAQAAAVPFWFRFENPHTETRDLLDAETGERIRKIAVDAIDVVFSEKTVVREGSWVVRAMLEHGAVGNVVTTFSGETDPEWHKLPSKCDHCGTLRTRKFTFIVENDRGDTKQVGKSCLKEYTGIDPELVVGIAAIGEYAYTNEDPCDNEPHFLSSLAPYYLIRDVLAAAVKSIKAHGYIKSNELGSTKANVSEILRRQAIDESCYKEADTILEWLKNQADSSFDLLSNAAYLALNNEYLALKDLGRMVYVPVVYMNEKAKKAEKRAVAEASTSEYVGTVGERMTIKMVSAQYITSFETAYGMTHVYNFTDAAGNKYVWFASSIKSVFNGCKITCTIKNHSEREGIKQTIITRCKVA